MDRLERLESLKENLREAHQRADDIQQEILKQEAAIYTFVLKALEPSRDPIEIYRAIVLHSK